MNLYFINVLLILNQYNCSNSTQIEMMIDLQMITWFSLHLFKCWYWLNDSKLFHPNFYICQNSAWTIFRGGGSFFLSGGHFFCRGVTTTVDTFLNYFDSDILKMNEDYFNRESNSNTYLLILHSIEQTKLRNLDFCLTLHQKILRCNFSRTRYQHVG